MESIRIPRKLINQILEQAQQSPNKEICGLLSSRNSNNSKQPVNCYPVANSSTEPNHRYLMDPGQQINAFKKIREKGEELYAIYHSHPQSPAYPSAEDLEKSSYPEALHIIVSMSTGGTLQLRGFRLNSGSIAAVDIAVE